MKNIVLKLTIPIPTEENVPVAAMIFHRWLPYKEGQGITILEENIEVNIKFDINSTIWASEQKIEDLPRWKNVTVYRLYADIIIKHVDDELIKFMRENIKEEKTPNPELRKQFELIGKRILDITLHHINRLITYCRVTKGQFWLAEFPIDYDMSNYYIHFKAKAKVVEDNSEWFTWRPTHTSNLGALANVDSTSYVEEKEWESINEFIFSNNRPNLVLELLSKSENLATNGYTRNAIIDCISALEIALSEFSKSPAKNIFTDHNNTRINVNNLHNQIEHLGFSGSMRYLIPIIFTEDQINMIELQNCYDGIDLRNNVIHNGQRYINKDKFYHILKSVKIICNFLICNTAT